MLKENSTLSIYSLKTLQNQDHVILNPKEKINIKKQKKHCTAKIERNFKEKLSFCHFFPCVKTFTSRENLDIHISNIHLNLKSFQCRFCENIFSHPSGN